MTLKTTSPSNNGDDTKTINNCHEPNWNSADFSQMGEQHRERCSFGDGTLSWNDIFRSLWVILFPEVTWGFERFVQKLLDFVRKLMTEKTLTNTCWILWTLKVCLGISCLVFTWLHFSSRRKMKIALLCSPVMGTVIWQLLEDRDIWGLQTVWKQSRKNGMVERLRGRMFDGAVGVREK